MKHAFLALTAALAIGGLSACETATPYQPLSAQNAEAGGYRDLRLDADHWRVSFSGNSVTNRETVERYLLYRAAELTVSQGFDWFVTNDQQTDRKTTTYVDPFYSSGFGGYYGYGWRPSWRFHRGGFGYGGGWGPGGPWGPVEVDTYNRYEVSGDISMGHGPKPPGGKALDAHEVMTNLGPGIQRPKV